MTSPLGPRSTSSVSCDGTINEARVDYAQRLIAQAQTFHHSRAKAFQHHVCAANQLLENLLSFMRLQIQGERAFVAVQNHMKAAVSPHAGRPPSYIVANFWIFHLDNISAEIRQQH